MQVFSRISAAINDFFQQHFSMSRSGIMTLHTITEILMSAFFFLMGAALVYVLYSRKKDLKIRWGFFPALVLFIAGLIHAVHSAAPWYPVYFLEIAMKFLAALTAIAALFVIRKAIPKLLALPLPSEARDLKRNFEKLSADYQNKSSEWARARHDFENEITQWEEEAKLLPSINETASETEDMDEAVEIALENICTTMGWEYGEAWIVNEASRVLEYSPASYGGERYEELRRVSRELRLPPHIGLPGTVWADKKPVVIEDILSSNGTFFQVPMCRELGLRSSIGVPVFMDGKVAAVLIFLMRNFGEGQKRRICLVSTAVFQLGCILEKKMSEKNVRDAQENQEKKIRERTKDLVKTNETLKEQIAERQRREESLIQSQENFSTLVNSIDGIVWEYDLRAAKFSFVSEQAERTLGYPVSAWMTEPSFWQEHIHGGDRPGVLAFRANVVQEKKGDKFEYRMITADGRTIWLRDMVKAVVENDEVVKLRGVMVNITEPKQVEEALYQERNFVSAVFETAGALVMVLDTEGRIIRFNRACEQISGIPAQAAKGRVFWELFSDEEEVAKAKMIFTRLLAGQFPINDESYWPAKDGGRCSIAWSNTVILNKYGAVVHVIATGIDITKRKEAEHQLKKAVSDLARSNKGLDKSSREVKEANQRLRELDEIKSHFISAASHELRTPLTSIKGYVESVLEDEVGPLNEQQRQFLGYVKMATDRLHRLLNELLDISKIESGQVRMSKSLTNLRNLLKEEVMIFKTQAQSKDIQMEIETEMSLREIYCDGDKVREIMDNLLSNAIKYTQQGGKIRVQAKNDERGILIDVADTGIGIAKDDLGRIFEPFQHIEKNGVEDEEESTGLGLTLVKRIVEAHDGKISVRSQQGNGSVFTVFLPAGEATESKKNALMFTAT